MRSLRLGSQPRSFRSSPRLPFFVMRRHSRSLHLRFAAVLAVALAGCDAGPTPSSPVPAEPPPAGSSETGGWRYVPVEGMYCRLNDGLGLRFPTGLFVRPAPAGSPHEDKVVIHLDGGGACYDAKSCARNAAAIDGERLAAFAGAYGARGIFLEDPRQPLYGWNAIHVPNCTGDVHSGANRQVYVEGVDFPQDFVGADNVRTALDWIVSGGLPPLSTVFVAGTSAGAFGVATHLSRFAAAFPDAKLVVIADSGILPEDDAVLADQTQQEWDRLWGVSAQVRPPCHRMFRPSGDGFEHILPCQLRRHPDVAFGYFGHVDDWSPRIHLAFENPNAVWSFNPVSGEMDWLLPLELTRAATLAYAARLGAEPNVGTFLYPGDLHTTLLSNRLWRYEVGGLSAAAWLQSLLDYRPGDELLNVGP